MSDVARPLPRCKKCGEEMALAMGDVVSAERSGPQESVVVEHSEAFQCVNESCSEYGVEVPGRR